MRRATVIALLFFALLFCATTAQAALSNVVYQLGFGARGLALGSAYTALGGDASTAFFNPAAMAALEHSEIMLSYVYAAPNFTGGPVGDTFTYDTPNQDIQANMALKLNSLFKSNFPLALGLNVALDENGAGFIRFYDVQHPEGYYYMYGPSSFTLNGSLGFGLTDWLFLGGGVVTVLHGPSDFYVTTDLGGRTSKEGLNLESDTIIAPVAAAFLHFTPVDVGLTYHGKTVGSLGPVKVNATATVGDSPLTKLPMDLFYKDSYCPHRVGLGAHWRILDNFNTVGDVVWYNWKNFTDEMSTGDLPRKDKPFEFKDTFVPHIGFEYEPLEHFDLRVGYGYQETPVVDPGDSSNVILDNTKHIISAGLGYTWQNPPLLAYPITFDGAYFMHYLMHRDITTVDSAEYESSGTLNGGALSITLRY